MPFTTLVSTEQLALHLSDPNWAVIDCRFTLTDTEAGRKAYALGHIPGARYAHLDADLSGAKNGGNGRHPLPDPQVFARTLGAWGIDHQTQVVVYDDSFGAMAVRLWWMLRWLGHDAVALLDGGLPKWQREQRALTADVPHVTPKHFVPNVRSDMLVGTEEVLEASQTHSALIIDARAEMRFIGEIEPLDPVAGHVPHAVNLPFDDNLSMAGTMMTAEELRELYGDLLDGKPPAQVIHMCGSGVTACHNILAMEIAGFPGSKLYAGSWSEWVADPAHPVAKGY
ncbi:MAG: 3-mercaptopyruvate sulfurtransferase [Betaproteobacteria bacterium RBG_19FT_COMBO_58_11]|nr:MAG: 3-mercaptopyruvate sulfurtransferase [Betaproteobacteria bacterium RBG_19FT_COMBO_58_11]